MPLLLDKILTALALPPGLALLLGLVALLALQRRRLGLATLTLLLGLGQLGLFSLPVTADALGAQLSAPYAPRSAEATPAAELIVVLGGGLEGPTAERPVPDFNHAADRLYYAAKLFHAGKAPAILVSGGSVWGLTQETEAAASAAVLQRLGVPEGRLRLEGDSRNTRENAVFSRTLAAETQRILLVTSASHIRRAQGCFEAVGFTVIPAATDFEDYSGMDPVLRWLPSHDALATNSRMLKEGLGLLVYRLRGWL